MRVALVYDRVNKWGGAERVLLALHELFPQAPLFTSVYAKNRASWAKVFTVKPSLLQKFPFARYLHELYAPFMPLAFENMSFDEYDLVISVTSEAAKGVITKPQTKHVCYCLTPTRYLWSGYDEYFKNPLFRWVTRPIVWYLQMWDKIAAERPDVLVAISKEVQERIAMYYKKKAVLLYPPATLVLDKTVPVIHKSVVKKQPPYFLVVSRLVPYKRIDIVIRACGKAQVPLKIIGKGVEEGELRRLAKQQKIDIEFLSNLTDQELVGYYRGCLALLFPGKEDLGLSIVEAQRFGKPVIAYRGGGALEIIAEGKTGEFFFPQTVPSLVEKIKKFKKRRYKVKDCILQAEKFSKEKFKEDCIQIIEKFMIESKSL